MDRVTGPAQGSDLLSPQCQTAFRALTCIIREDIARGYWRGEIAVKTPVAA